MKRYNIHEAKTHFSKIVAEVEAGEDVRIARAGRPSVRMVKDVEERKPLRKAGLLADQIWIAPDYDKAKDEIRHMFEDSINAPLDAKP